MLLQLLFVLVAIIVGARLGGIGLGVMGGVGLAILTFVFGLQPTAPPIDEICYMAGALYRDPVWNGLVLYPDRGQSRVAAASDS